MKNVIELAEGSFNNIFQDSVHKILTQQLTPESSYIFNILILFRQTELYVIPVTFFFLDLNN